MHMHAKSDSEVTSLAPSSPTRSPRRPVYYVQSPSRDSHDGEKMSFQSTPILSPMGSPPHSSSSLGRHSRESSTSRFSGSLKPGSRKVQPHDGRHGKGKGWNQCSVIEEEGEFDESDEKKWPKRCYVLLFILCFALLFTLFSLILWGASRPFKPEISVTSITFHDFYISAGSDATGVPTKMISLNSTLRMSFYNPATFFGMHVTSTSMDLMYYQLAVASGQVRNFYQSKKSHRTLHVVLQGNKVPLYGGGASLSSSDAIGNIPLDLSFTIRARAYVLGKLVKPKFLKHIQCNARVAAATRWLVEKWQRENPNLVGESTIEAENTIQVEVVSPSPIGKLRNAAVSLDRGGAQVSGCVDGSTQGNNGND
ncbi:hypothetical protein KI387_035376 [Taxus chinensis]|uniref:Late embryogenesis abundant protein LEA-2 subgroup domain-containing protein n=1 Tax=Taxus chinensis TaxID=29808 RepID=A0AA38FND8_TAXCH|nr:hypothetical protein KI387_035376 [Taxus chinensis]